MKVVQPQVLIIASTQIHSGALQEMLVHLDSPGWQSNESSDGELLTEVAGRLCYKSFKPGLNPNVTKVREGNKEYIGNILKQKHGSVLEHATATIAFLNVSRIFTHELVRHRAGMAYSQESMRFVRMDDIPMYLPHMYREFGELAKIVTKKYPHLTGDALLSNYGADVHEMAILAEQKVNAWGKLLDTPGVSFHIKKAITSALRRFVPGGHTTNIIATGNHRAWRHMIEMRTSEGAEVEIREIFRRVAHRLHKQFPHFYQDMEENGDRSITFRHNKV
jgi:thymidylate synthase (FAD)